MFVAALEATPVLYPLGQVSSSVRTLYKGWGFVPSLDVT